MLEDLKAIFKQDDEYTELELVEEEKKQVPIIVDKIENFTCADRIIRNVREGKIVFARIKDIKNMNTEELKRAIQKIKNVCVSIDGDIAAIADEWLIVAPSLAKVSKE